MKILVPVGTRPEILKVAPVVVALRAHGHDVVVAATGQQNDPAMVDAAHTATGVPAQIVATVADGPGRAGNLYNTIVGIIADTAPDVVMAVGDTNTVTFAALAARGHQIPFMHLEAGLRSFNDRSTEELNRKVVADCASIHFAPTTLAVANLHREGIDPARVFCVGNPIIDALVATGIERVAPAERHGVLFTAHRATNVDDPARLARIVELVAALSTHVGPVTFPVHPRTRSRLVEHGLDAALDATGANLVGPTDWHTTLRLLARSAVVVTDSGGLQEEAAHFGVGCVVLRRSTPRWEGIRADIAALATLDGDTIAAAVDLAATLADPQVAAQVAATPCPYGDGTTGIQIAALLDDLAVRDLLVLDEPDLTGWMPTW